jgi:hypothetical protein
MDRIMQRFQENWQNRTIAAHAENMDGGLSHGRTLVMGSSEQDTLSTCWIHPASWEEERAQTRFGVRGAHGERSHKRLARPSTQGNKLQKMLRQAIILRRSNSDNSLEIILHNPMHQAPSRATPTRRCILSQLLRRRLANWRRYINRGRDALFIGRRIVMSHFIAS